MVLISVLSFVICLFYSLLQSLSLSRGLHPLFYTNFASYFTAFFEDPANKDCAAELEKRGVNFVSLLIFAGTAVGVDFWDDRNAYWTTTAFSALPTKFQLSGPNDNFNAISYLQFRPALTFNNQFTIVVGALFAGLSAPQKNLTIVHEVLHIFFNTPEHVPIAQKLGLGTFTGDDADFKAGQAIDTFLSTDCGHNK